MASAAIGVPPTYPAIGWFAPLLLIIPRLARGIAVGGERGCRTAGRGRTRRQALNALYSSEVRVGYSVALLIVDGFPGLMSATLPNMAFQRRGTR